MSPGLLFGGNAHYGEKTGKISPELEVRGGGGDNGTKSRSKGIGDYRELF